MRLTAALALCALPLAAAAQDKPNTMIVLDGSGSMWGQIEGVNKIVIAREVLGTILEDFPAEENLGLTVYGHRERGNCADIETIVPTGPGTVAAIREAANAINPRGKTPMTDAVVAAAEALRYTEERATVVLVSDGVETCNPDPCAAARALEEAGIDFTAHVVGFDVTDPEALAQMQCLADETGGTFTTASNAAELTTALQQVTVAEPEPEPEPEPVPVAITFAARLDTEDGPPVDGPVFWTVTEVEGEREGNPLELPMTTGSYEVEAYWAAQEVAQARQFIVGDSPREIVLVFETPAPTATLTAPDSAIAGTTIEVGWNGPNAEGDFVGIRAEGADGYHRHTNTTALSEGNPLPLLMPIPPGDWVIEYVSADRSAVAEHPITIEPVEATVTAPGTAPAGATIEVGWTGPRYDGDFIGIRSPERDDYHRFVNSADLGENPAALLMPGTAGDYIVEYIAGQNRSSLAATPLTVEAATATVTAPSTAAAGSEIEVGWTGPNYEDDFIGIRSPDRDDYHRFANTAKLDDNPTTLLIPAEPGGYLIEYIQGQDRIPLAVSQITAEAVGATIVAPSTAPAGSIVEVGWTGPQYEGDFIGIRSPERDDYHRFANTADLDENPAALLIPAEPGDYLIEYIQGQSRSPLAVSQIVAEPLTASITAPSRAAAGATVEVGWTGPAYDDDFIGIRSPERDDYHRFVNSAKLGQGSPVDLLLPPEPGDYVIEYITGQNRAPIAVSTIRTDPVDASITAPPSGAAGSVVEIAWSGPEYPNDFIAIRKAGAEGYHRFSDFAERGAGGIAMLTLPNEPGAYLVEYIEGQGRSPLAEAPLEVTAR